MIINDDETMEEIVTVMSKTSELETALLAADSGVLLAILVQLTGDLNLLDRLEPLIDHVPNMPEKVGVAPKEVHEEIVEMLMGFIDSNEIPTGSRGEVMAPVAWEHDVAKRIFNLGLGDKIGDDYVPMLFEQGGFRDPQSVGPKTKQLTKDKKLVVVGAGLGGIIAGITAKRAGIDFEIFDRNPDVGGTWLVQKYPGVGVDTPSQYYSISTHLNPDWSSYYPKGGEYQEYLERVVKEENLAENIKFRTEVIGMKWDENDAQWQVTYMQDGVRKNTSAHYVMTAAGYLNRPKYPDWQGIESFAGISIHSSEWPEGIDLTGKRVAVVGTGCTAVQVVDAVAKDVKSMHLFQRQPHWVAPRKRDSDDVPENDQTMLKQLPLYTQWRRLKSFWGSADNGYPVVIVDPEWAANHVSISPINDILMQDALAFIDSSFGAGSELAKKMTPDFAPFGKRIIRDPGGYYQALKQDNISVTNDAPQRVVAEGIIDSEGTLIEVDVIIYCTGYYLDYLSNIKIEGVGGKTLTEEWGNAPRAYRGGMVPGFPNMFVTSGPNQNPSHGAGNNFALEVLTHYFRETIQMLAERGNDYVEVTREAYEDYNRQIDEDMERTVWRNTDNAHTYYRNEDGRVVLASPWKLVDVWQGSRLPNPDHLTFGNKKN